VDPTADGTTEDARLREIRGEIDAARSRIAEGIDALTYKADVPSRLGDMLASMASSVTARVLERLPTPSVEDVEGPDASP
jgi:hypothetical protein